MTKRPTRAIWRPLAGLVLLVIVAYAVSAATGRSSLDAPFERSGPFRGVGLTRTERSCRDLDVLGVSWYYAWWHDEPCPQAAAEFVPMVWGDWCADGSDCAQLPEDLVAEGVHTLLGFNEPEREDQAYLDVDRALDLWELLSATPVRLGSPAVSGSDDLAQNWLDRFMAGVADRDLRVDFIAVHWYGDCSSTADLESFLDDLQRFGLPIWITEFSCWWQDEATNAAFLAEAGPVLARYAQLERIAWFSNRAYPGGWEGTGLVGRGGQLSAIGEVYASLPS